MPSKTSKTSRSRSAAPASRTWKAASTCSEPELLEAARKLALELKAQDRVLLEGPMGAGKTTFSRALLEGMGVVQPPEGSPSFAIAHEYEGSRCEVIHIDFYRLRGEAEISEAGIEAYFWERDRAVVIAEWTSLFPEFEKAVVRSTPGTLWRVRLDFVEAEPSKRKLEIASG